MYRGYSCGNCRVINRSSAATRHKNKEPSTTRRTIHVPPQEMAEPRHARRPPAYMGWRTTRYGPDVTTSCPSLAETVWLQFRPRHCRAQTRMLMPAMHRTTPTLLATGLPGAKLRNRKVER